jgi:hypothetical protein
MSQFCADSRYMVRRNFNMTKLGWLAPKAMSIVLVVTRSLSMHVASVSASDKQRAKLQIVKNCDSRGLRASILHQESRV